MICTDGLHVCGIYVLFILYLYFIYFLCVLGQRISTISVIRAILVGKERLVTWSCTSNYAPQVLPARHWIVCVTDCSKPLYLPWTLKCSRYAIFRFLCFSFPNCAFKTDCAAAVFLLTGEPSPLLRIAESWLRSEIEKKRRDHQMEEAAGPAAQQVRCHRNTETVCRIEVVCLFSLSLLLSHVPRFVLCVCAWECLCVHSFYVTL